MKNRVDGQIDWMEDKSKKAKKAFHILKVTQICLASFIPFATGFIDYHYSIKFIAGFIGVAAVLLTGLLDILNVKDNWINYRIKIERLKTEKYLFLTLAPPYDVVDPFKKFVSKIEEIHITENANWGKDQAKPSEEN